MRFIALLINLTAVFDQTLAVGGRLNGLSLQPLPVSLKRLVLLFTFLHQTAWFSEDFRFGFSGFGFPHGFNSKVH